MTQHRSSFKDGASICVRSGMRRDMTDIISASDSYSLVCGGGYGSKYEVDQLLDGREWVLIDVLCRHFGIVRAIQDKDTNG